jgi:hypothetical protein
VAIKFDQLQKFGLRLASEIHTDTVTHVSVEDSNPLSRSLGNANTSPNQPASATTVRQATAASGKAVRSFKLDTMPIFAENKVRAKLQKASASHEVEQHHDMSFVRTPLAKT